MHSRPPSIQRLLFAGVALLAMACSNEEEGLSDSPRVPAVETAIPDAAPKPVASADLPNGNTLEFFDFKSGALVVESGKAGVVAHLGKEPESEALAKASADPGEKLAAIWKSAAPDRAVPKALLDMQERWKHPPAGVSLSREIPSGPGAAGIRFEVPDAPSAPLGKKATPVGCNNGCCDAEWLATFGQCQGGDWPISWFLFNYGYTWANYSDADYVNGMVCAANGNSSWKMKVGSSGGTWTVTPAHYKAWKWVSGWFDEDMKSSVNSSTSQALHTYCGVLYR